MNFVTVVKTAKSCNKQWDGKKMSFSRPFTQATGHTQRIKSVSDLHLLIEAISDKTDCVLIPGGYFPQYTEHDKQFNIMAATEMKRRGVVDVAGIQSIGGNDYIARLKSNMEPSNVILWDYDQADGMPKEWLNKTPDELVMFMRSVLGEQVGFVAVESTSARCEGLEKGKGCHLYCLIEDAADLERFKAAWMAQGFAQGWSFLKPTHCRKDIPARGLQAGDICAYVPWGVFDPSVLASCERLDFIGKPDGKGVIDVSSAKIVLYDGIPADTSTVKSLDDAQHKKVKETLKKAGISLTSNDDFKTSKVGGISLSDSIETEAGNITVSDFISSQHEKLRCQIPSHIRDSSSWNGILRMTDKGTALLYDQGTRTSYFLPDSEVANIGSNTISWGEPEPFNVLEYPALPSKQDMPPQLWQIANYAAQQAGTNTSFSFASLLSALAAVYRGKVYVARKDGSIKNLVTVFAINAALSGEGKSATRSYLDRPLQEIAANLKKQCSEAIARWRTEANAAKKSIKALEKNLSEDLRDMTPMEEASNLNQMNLINSPPKVGLAIYSQSTPEAFIEKCDSDGFVMLSTDEGSAVVESFGRYSNQSGADMSPILKAFDGSIDNVARRGDNSYGGVLKGCLDLSVQPSVLNRIVGDEEMRTRGFINRFIIMVTPTTAGTLDYHHRPTHDEALEKRWHSLVMRMNSMVEALGDSETTILLDDEADRLHSDYANSYQPRVAEDGDLESMKDSFSRRHPAYVMRLAALYHPLMGGTLDSKISPETMRYAIASGKLIANHYIAAVGSASSPETNRAKKTIEKLIKAGIQQISVRDLSRKHWTGTASSDEALFVLQTLHEMGWVREIAQQHNGGRPPSPLFELHPESSVFISQTQVTKVPQVPKGVEKEAFGTLGSSGTSPKEIKKAIRPTPKIGELGDDGKIIRANQPPANEDLQHTIIAPVPKFVEVF